METTAAILMTLTVWLGLAAVVAVAARNRERSAVLYFLVSVVASPILAIILLAISGGLQSKRKA